MSIKSNLPQTLPKISQVVSSAPRSPPAPHFCFCFSKMPRRNIEIRKTTMQPVMKMVSPQVSSTVNSPQWSFKNRVKNPHCWFSTMVPVLVGIRALSQRWSQSWKQKAEGRLSPLKRWILAAAGYFWQLIFSLARQVQPLTYRTASVSTPSTKMSVLPLIKGMGDCCRLQYSSQGRQIGLNMSLFSSWQAIGLRSSLTNMVNRLSGLSCLTWQLGSIWWQQGSGVTRKLRSQMKTKAVQKKETARMRRMRNSMRRRLRKAIFFIQGSQTQCSMMPSMLVKYYQSEIIPIMLIKTVYDGRVIELVY